MSEISTKPYLLRAIYEWCTDSGFTPYLAVKVDGSTTVPMEYVRKGEIILNISFGATSALKMDNDAVHFRARFNGVSREIYIPVHNVIDARGRDRACRAIAVGGAVQRRGFAGGAGYGSVYPAVGWR
jgi:stringent starvation protein B